MTRHRSRFRVPFDETDPGGALFFGHLFRHAHQAYEGFLEAMGLSLTTLIEEGIALPLVRAEADYHRPMKLGDTIEVELRVKSVGDRSFALDYAFLREGTRCATATTVHAAVERATGRSRPLPTRLREELSKR